MARTPGSDNRFPKIRLLEGSAPDTPDAGEQRVYASSTDNRLYALDSAAAAHPITDVELAELADVNAPAPDDGDVLAWDDGAGEWAPAAPSGGGGLSDQDAFTYLDATEAAAPSTPASGYVRIYAKTDGRIYSMDDAGTEYGPFDEAGSGDSTDSSVAAVGTNWARFLGAIGYGADGNTTGYSAAATDGNQTSNQLSSSTATVPHSTILELSQRRPVSRVDLLFSDANHRAEEGEIRYSDDGSSWTTAASWTGETGATHTETFDAVVARYWKIYCTKTGSPGSTGMDIREAWLIYAGADGSATDLASGLTPTSNETISNPTNATNNSEANAATATTYQANSWFRVDLGSALEVAGCIIKYDDTSHAGAVGRIQYSSNDADWSDAASFAYNNDQLWRCIPFDSPVTARYWRVYHDYKGNSNGSEYQLFQLWG